MLGGISPHFQAWAFGWISNSETPGTVNRGLTQKFGGSAKCSEAPYVHGAHLHGMEGPRTLAPIRLSRCPLCSLYFIPDDIILMSVISLRNKYGEVMDRYIGRCISTVHIRWCSAGISQQWLIIKWLGLSVTVRVRVMARAREWFVHKCDGHHLLYSPSMHCQSQMSI